MNDPVDIIRAIIRDELTSYRFGDIAVVTSVFPHAEGDDNNYECSVKLRESELELRRVPMATPHIGMASTPRVGDLVLVTYVAADPNRPIVVGRLHSDRINPPVHEAGELVIETPVASSTSIRIDARQAIVIKTGENVLTIHKDGDIEVAGQGQLSLTVTGDVAIKCSDATIDASGEINLGAGGTPVITEGSHKCYYSGAPLVGVQSVKAKGG